MLDVVKSFIVKLNEFGIPLPLLRDNKTGAGSISLTMMFISFNVVLIGLIGKWSKALDIDLQQAIYWFMITSGLYFGRSLTNSGNKIELNNKEEEK